MPVVPQGSIELNAFIFKINNFKCHLRLPHQWGLVDLLTQAAKLYYGFFSAEYFRQVYTESLNQKLTLLLGVLNNPADHAQIKLLDFQLTLMHQALQQKWRLPLLITKYQQSLIWHTGGTRVFASGMAHTSAYDLPLILLDFDQKDLDLFDNLKEITSDQELCEILDIEHFGYNQHQPTRLDDSMEVFLEWQETPGPCLQYINPSGPIVNWQTHERPEFVTDLLPVLGRVLTEEIIYYSDHPNQIIDSSKRLNLKWGGPSQLETDDFTFSLWRLMNSDKPCLFPQIWVRPGHRIDASEILFWLQDHRNIYLDKDDRFAVLLPGQSFEKKFIRISR